MRQRELQTELVPLGMRAGDRGARRDMVVPELQSQRSVLHQAIGDETGSFARHSKD